MDNKTKDAIKQMQTEIRQLHALVADSQSTSAAVEPPSDTPVREKHAMPALVAPDQLSHVTDDAVAGLGYALSSAPKVALLRALLTRDSESATALGAEARLSTGSLYHHLRDLMHAGLITQAGRNQYALSERGRRVLLVFLALAAEK